MRARIIALREEPESWRSRANVLVIAVVAHRQNLRGCCRRTRVVRACRLAHRNSRKNRHPREKTGQKSPIWAAGRPKNRSKKYFSIPMSCLPPVSRLYK